MIYKSVRIYVPIIIGLSLLILVLGMKPLYSDYMDIESQVESINFTKQEKQKTLNTLIAMKESLENGSGSMNINEKVKKLMNTWNESKIISSIMLNDYTKATEFGQASITIRSISLDRGIRLPSGLNLGTVQLSIDAQSVDDVVNYLTYLTGNSGYMYIFDTISLPISTSDQDNSNVSLPVSLGVYYYE